MANMKEVFGDLLKVAKAAAPIVGMGLPEAIKLGESIVALIDNVTADEDSPEIEALIAERDELEERVNAHVNATRKKLRGE